MLPTYPFFLQCRHLNGMRVDWPPALVTFTLGAGGFVLVEGVVPFAEIWEMMAAS